MPANLGERLDQYHEVTSVLGLTAMINDMTGREQEQLEQEENNGELHEPASEAEEAENLTEESR
jgi:hypothetical protein